MSLEQNSPIGKKSHSSRYSNLSTKERPVTARIQAAELRPEASSVERKHAAEYEAEAFKMQEQMVKVEAWAKVFESMDQQSIKSDTDAIKTRIMWYSPEQ